MRRRGFIALLGKQRGSLAGHAGADAVILSELHAGRDNARPVQANPC